MSRNFGIRAQKIEGLFEIKRSRFSDDRGWFEKCFCEDALHEILLGKKINQINFSHSDHRGVVRGMHYQVPPFMETKIVTCLKGEVFDVAIDLRRKSKTFLQWHGSILSENNKISLVIPEGFAHGFQSLTDNCELLYLHTAPYNPEFERVLNPMDSTLGIKWPCEVRKISKRDGSAVFIERNFEGLSV